MPGHQHWIELPADVRHEVERHTGLVLSAYPISDGSSCDLAVTLVTASGRVFCKGGEVGNPTTRLHRNEARVSPWLPDVAPRLLCTVERCGWLILGFEYAAGQAGIRSWRPARPTWSR